MLEIRVCRLVAAVMTRPRRTASVEGFSSCRYLACGCDVRYRYRMGLWFLDCIIQNLYSFEDGLLMTSSNWGGVDSWTT